jgi:hypothetical protein
MRALVVARVGGRIGAKTTLMRDHCVMPCLKARSQRRSIRGISS